MYKYQKIMVRLIKECHSVCEISNDCLSLKYPRSLNFSDLSVIPVMRKQNVKLHDFHYIGFQNTHKNENEYNERKTVGFFTADYRVERVCMRPWNYIGRLRQYKQVLSPDLSCYTDMPLEEQWLNIFWGRFIGVYWQNCGITVIPTITWGDESSYDFCFKGVEKGSVAAVSTIGTKRVYSLFMAGFKELCKRIEPECVICYCMPYPEMRNYAKILTAEYEGIKARELAKYKPLPGQLEFKITDGRIDIMEAYNYGR